MYGDVQIAPWPGGRRFAYSITYDEGLVEVLGFAWRLHRDYQVPGHVNVYPSLLGKLEGDTSSGFLQSLWNLRKYAEPGQLRWLAEQGWTVGCQFGGPAAGLQDAVALAAARRELEACLGAPVVSLALGPGVGLQANAGSRDVTVSPGTRAAAEAAGFRWLMMYYDDINPAAGREDVIHRSPLYHRGPVPNRLANDPYRLLQRATDEGAWVVDVVRTVDRYPADPTRDCTPAELERRFQAVYEIGEGAAWLANVETAAAYRACRTVTTLEQGPTAAEEEVARTVRVAAGAESAGISLTFLVTVDPGRAPPRAYADDVPVALQAGDGPGRWQFTCAAPDGLRLRVVKGGEGT